MVFIKTLGVSYLGIDSLFADILSLLSLAEFGLDTVITYRLYKPVADGDLSLVRTYISFFKSAYKIIGIVVLIIGLLCIPLLKFIIVDYNSLETIGINVVLIFVLYLAQSVSSYLFYAYRGGILKAYQKLYIVDIIVYSSKIGSCFVQIAILLFTKSFVLYVLTLVLFCIFQNLTLGYVANRLFPQCFLDSEKKLAFTDIKSLLKDCGALFFFKMNSIVMRATDSIVLSVFIGLFIVGMYSNYWMVYMGAFTFVGIMLKSFSASLGNFFASEEVKHKYFLFNVMNFYSVIIFGAASVCIAVVGDEFIGWWVGDELVIAKPFSFLLGLLLYLGGLKLNLAQTREVSGVFKQMWFRPLWGSLINIFFSVILVNYWGVSGVVVGTLLASLFANLAIDPVVIYKYCFKKFYSVKYYYFRNVIYLVSLSILSAISYWLCSLIVIEERLLSMSIHLALCVIISAFGMGLVFWRTKECRYIRKKTMMLIQHNYGR